MDPGALLAGKRVMVTGALSGREGYMTKSLMLEWVRYGIRVNASSPVTSAPG
jgi:hypothetical protein